MNIFTKGRAILILSVAVVSNAFAQEPAMQAVPLNDMSAFQPQAGNWFIVGDVTMDPTVDVHHAGEEKRKRRRKRNKGPQAVTYQAGEGVLLNMNTGENKSQLVTTWEHGDIDLTMEVMLPKGSNSGIYLQGRYEVQLYDSWGVKDPAFSDMGGIYRNWEKEPGKIYLGKAPLENAAKAPGLWQTLKISFRAPRFDADGKKIANARFVSVELNGRTIHDNIEVPLPTGGPIENNEVPTGPLMIQGDHGPVAFRNIKYHLLGDSEVTLKDIKYEVFYGDIKTDDISAVQPDRTGTLPKLTWEVANADSAFYIRYTGSINVPKDDAYDFALNVNGVADLSIGEANVVSNRRRRGTVTLKKGIHPVEIWYHRNALWQEPRLGLFVKSKDTHKKALHTYNSFPPDLDAVAPIFIEPGSEPKLIRAFLDFRGQRDKRLTHTIAVGSPDKVHYIYDLKAGNIVCAWRGRFINATPMWHSRGDGSYRPIGAVQYLFMGPSLATLNDMHNPFPTENNDLKECAYEIEEGSGRPVFSYTYKGMEVSDKIYPDEQDRALIREVMVKNVNGKEVYLKLAEGIDISAMPDGSYVVGGQHYIKVLSSTQPAIREVNGQKELLLRMDQNPVKYSIIW